MQPDQDTSLAATVDAPPGWRSRFDSRNMLRWESGLAVAEIAIMALPMTLIIISGEIDLSVASIMGMSSAVLGYLWGKHWSMLVIFVVILLVGVLAGAINGLLITRLGLPSLAVTIGTLGLYRGVANIILGPNTISNFPASYANIGVTGVLNSNLSFSAAVFIVLAVIFGVVLHYMPVGRSIYAMGASPEAAIFAGIRVKRIKTLLYIVSGVVCSLAGVLLTFRLSTSVNSNGLGLELDVVAVVLLGGVSIFGGKGTIVGVVLAFAGIQNALLLTNFNQEAASIPVGGLLLVSVFVPNMATLTRRIRGAIARRSKATPSAIGAGHD